MHSLAFIEGALTLSWRLTNFAALLQETLLRMTVIPFSHIPQWVRFEVFPEQKRCQNLQRTPPPHCSCSTVSHRAPAFPWLCGLTYNFQTSEDRHVHPSGNPPGAWGTRHEWSTWGDKGGNQYFSGGAAVSALSEVIRPYLSCTEKLTLAKSKCGM